jgi:class 3 adenylate cyclase/tetratricopeptide (TPR) repeat protein
MPEERRTVTVLFADIVGSTRMADQHDPEIIRAALAGAFDDISPVIAEHGGTVEKFIGDAVMAVFGVPSAHDDDAERAVRAAFATRDLMARLGGPLRLDVRVGVSTGEVVTKSGGGDQRLVTGLPVNLAQRFQAAASPGEILVGEHTCLLTQRAVRYGHSRQVEAKGVGTVTAMPAEELLTAVPEGRLTIEGRRPPMLGRHKELTRLRKALSTAAAEGRAVLVTLMGAAGVGKTRLAEEFVAGIDEKQVMRGRCLPYGEGAAAYPVQRILRREAGVEIGDSAEAASEKLRARVRQVVGPGDELDALQSRVVVYAGVAQASDLLADIPGGDVAEELRWAFRTYVERRAARAPAVLLFEDVHWAAPALLDLIEHLADWSRAPLLLLCLTRPDLRDTRPSWGVGRPHSASIELEPLEPRETSELIRALLPAAIPSDLLEREVITRSEGNPLYVEEFVRALIETGQIVLQEGRWVPVSAPSLKVPLTLQGLIEARLDRVSIETKRVLEEAAVVGRAFSSSALGVLHGGAVAAALREATKSGLITEAEAWTRGRGTLYSFRHVLFRDVAYGMLPKTDRSLLHDRYRQWLEDTVGDRRDEMIEGIADHAEQAHRLATEVQPAEAPRLARIAFDRLRAAADRARDRGDLHSSLELWRRAKTVGEMLGLSDEERLQTEENLLLLRASFERGDELWSDIGSLLDRARRSRPSEPFVRLLIASGWRMYTSSVERSAELMNEAFAAAETLGDHELITYALLQLPVVPLARGELDEVGRLREKTLKYAKNHGVSRELSACLRALAQWELRSGEFSRADVLLAEAEQLARQISSKAALFAALSSRAEVAIWTGPWDEAVEQARRLAPLAADLATHEAQIDYLNYLGLALFEAGDFRGARSAHEAAIRSTDMGTFEFGYSVLHVVFALIALGEVSEARRLYAAVMPIDIPWQNYQAVSATAAAALDAAEGKVDSADVLYRRAIAIFEDATTAPTRWRWAQQLYAEFLLKHGRLAEARRLLEEVRDFYRDPLAAPRRQRIEELLVGSVGVSTT